MSRKTNYSRLRSLRGSLKPYYHKRRRSFPWRKTRDPYAILVSEMMLQQTQVERVVPYYRAFLKEFPTLRSLARSSLVHVLRKWQGLGYNRRAKMLHEASQRIVALYGGIVPSDFEDLKSLPGIGEYTAHALRVFAWNAPDVLIETNVRTVFLHHFFPRSRNVTDATLLRTIGVALDRKNPRQFYSALMDYGSFLKVTTVNPSRRGAGYSRQTRFKGSRREVRGAILRFLIQQKASVKDFSTLEFKTEAIDDALRGLIKEGMVVKRRQSYEVAR